MEVVGRRWGGGGETVEARGNFEVIGEFLLIGCREHLKVCAALSSVDPFHMHFKLSSA